MQTPGVFDEIVGRTALCQSSMYHMCPTHGQAQFFRTEDREDVAALFSADFGVNGLEFTVEFILTTVCCIRGMQECEDLALDRKSNV